MMVSEPSSRMPPRTLSLRPLMTELTVITVVMPMTIPRMVSAERRGFLRNVSKASSTSSRSFKPLSLRIRKPSGSAVVCGRVLPRVAMDVGLFGSKRFNRVELCRFGRRVGAEKKPNAQRDCQAAQHRPKANRARQWRQPGNHTGDQHSQEHAQRAANYRDGRRFN